MVVIEKSAGITEQEIRKVKYNNKAVLIGKLSLNEKTDNATLDKWVIVEDTNSDGDVVRKMFIYGKDGKTVFLTKSESFMRRFVEMANDLDGDDVEVYFTVKKSNRNPDRNFISIELA